MTLASALSLIMRGHVPRRSRNALYAGTQVGFGKRYSNEYEKPSRRMWKPNVVKTMLFSEALGQRLMLSVTTTALREIDHAGGLDNWLMRTPDRLLQSDMGSTLKFRIGLLHQQRAWEALQRRRQQAEASRRPHQAGAQLDGGSSSSHPSSGTQPSSSASDEGSPKSSIDAL